MVGFQSWILDYVHIVKYLPPLLLPRFQTLCILISTDTFLMHGYIFFFFFGHMNSVKNSDDHKESTTLARSVHGFEKSLPMLQDEKKPNPDFTALEDSVDFQRACYRHSLCTARNRAGWLKY